MTENVDLTDYEDYLESNYTNNWPNLLPTTQIIHETHDWRKSIINIQIIDKKYNLKKLYSTGYNQDGFDQYGYNCDGFDQYGYNQYGYKFEQAENYQTYLINTYSIDDLQFINLSKLVFIFDLLNIKMHSILSYQIITYIYDETNYFIYKNITILLADSRLITHNYLKFIQLLP